MSMMEFGSKFAYWNDDMEGEDEADEELFEEELADEQTFDIEAALEEDDDRKTCYLEILDTAGQEEYSELRDQYYRESSGFVFVFDLTDKTSFDQVREIIKEAKKASNNPDPFCVLVGNKSDLRKERKVKQVEGRRIARKNKNMEYIETSAKSGNNIEKAFKTLITLIPRTGRQYKVAVLGVGGVGKSAIVLRYCREEFVDEYDPTIEDVFRKTEVMQKPLKTKVEKKKLKTQKKIQALTKRIGAVKKATTNIISLNIGSIAEPLKEGEDEKKDGDEERLKDKLPPRPSEEGEDKSAVPPEVVPSPADTSPEAPKPAPVKNIEPVPCSECAGVLNKFCKISADGRSWICTFCETLNPIKNMEVFEIPDSDTIEFCIHEAPKIYKDDDLVVFVVDTSGSMCVSTEIPRGFGMVQVGGGREQDDMRKMIMEMNKTLGQDEQLEVPPRRRNDRFVSRIQCMQSAIDIQLEELLKQHPERRVIMITFNNAITVYGPKGQKIRVEGEEKLENFDVLMETGLNKLFKYEELEPITNNKEVVSGNVKKLVEGGQTALGPALVVALGLCGQDKGLRKEVIVCTDGVANIGLGKKSEEKLSHEERLMMMEDNFLKTDPFRQNLVEHIQKRQFSDCSIRCAFEEIAGLEVWEDPRESFFSKLGTIALDNSTTISSIGIADEEDCDMEMMEVLANTTGGSIHVVNPLELQRKMREILDQEKIAQDVRVKFVMDPAFQFEEGEDADLTTMGTKKVNPIRKNEMEMRLGVAHQETDLTLEYTPNLEFLKKRKAARKRKKKKILKKLPDDDKELKSQPPIEEGGKEKDPDDENKKKLDDKLPPLPPSIGDDEEEVDEVDDEDEDGKKKKKLKTTVPFQSQITFTKLDGSKYIRIQTIQREVTKKRSDAEQEANFAVVSQHNIKKSSAMGKKGRLRDARLNLHRVQKMQKRSFNPMMRNVTEKKEESMEWMYRAKKLDTELMSLEAEDEGDDDEDDEGSMPQSSSGGGFLGLMRGSSKSKPSRKRKKKKKISDRSRGLFHRMEKESISHFKSSKKKNISSKKRHLGKYKK